MQSLLYDRGDVGTARDFCKQADIKLKGTNPDVLGACFHGIGHGLVDDDGAKKWISEAEMVEPALRLCATVAAPDEHLLYRCGSGVFNAMAIAYSSGNLKKSDQDPLWFCRQVKTRSLRMSCYDEMNTFLIKLSNGDFARAIRPIELISEDSEALSATRSLAQVYSFYSSRSDYDVVLDSCRGIQKRLGLMCIYGFAAGLVETGKPGSEYSESSRFCTIKDLENDERAACFRGLLWYLGRLYPQEKSKEFCGNVQIQYRSYCTI
jgi:hypothetical protein